MEIKELITKIKYYRELQLHIKSLKYYEKQLYNLSKIPPKYFGKLQ